MSRKLLQIFAAVGLAAAAMSAIANPAFAAPHQTQHTDLVIAVIPAHGFHDTALHYIAHKGERIWFTEPKDTPTENITVTMMTANGVLRQVDDVPARELTFDFPKGTENLAWDDGLGVASYIQADKLGWSTVVVQETVTAADGGPSVSAKHVVYFRVLP